jgi:kumamolisin
MSTFSKRAATRLVVATAVVAGLGLVSINASSARGTHLSVAGPTKPGLSAAPLFSTSPGTLIGPAREKSVSFLVLLSSNERPSCFLRWASADKLSVDWVPGQTWASVSGSPHAVDHGFHVVINDYRLANGSKDFTTTHPARVPSGVCGQVAGVGTIHSYVQPQNLDVPSGGLTGVELARAYDALPLLDQGLRGQGETVVFIETEGFNQSDLAKFAADENLPGYNVSVVGKNPGGSGETSLDMETVHAVAPDARLVYVPLLGPLDSSATSVADLFTLTISRVARQFPGSIFSISLGFCEENTQFFDRADLMALNAAALSAEAQGATIFASSGDAGGLDCTPSADDGDSPQGSFEGVEVPADLPAVTGTGGTALSTDAQGDYIGETTWSEPFLSQGAGGGVSHYFGRPSWQTGVGTGGQIDVDSGRQVPDVSSDADPNTGMLIIAGGSPQQVGGTSLAAPTWAGFTALMDQDLVAHHDRPVGFFNPVLYRLASSSVPYPPYHDITVGGNDFYLATPGYDMVTGLGSPDVYNLARDLLAGKY